MTFTHLRKILHQTLRKIVGFLPTPWRFALFRALVRCDFSPDARLQLKIAETREELEACFKLLHDAYVGSGFMTPHPSGMRVTLYHAMPTTTTLCAKFDGRVVGTISLIRDGVFGFPMQSVFDLSEVRAKQGNIAEVSALAVHQDFRKTGGAILFPLMKFMYEYCTRFFDTRHLVIAVNPDRIEMYESLLFFQRLTANQVDSYDFANGAPAVGATLDLHAAPKLLRAEYRRKPKRRNLYAYFIKHQLANIELPRRRYHTTNDPVMTPDILNYFFNVRTDTFSQLDERKKALLHSIYELPEYHRVLPALTGAATNNALLREHNRYSFKCPGEFSTDKVEATPSHALQLIELSEEGFQAWCEPAPELNVWGRAVIRLGPKETATVNAMAIRGKKGAPAGFFGFCLGDADLAWKKFVMAARGGKTSADLEHATVFMR
jgi:GNAT superfamily N-acetyltransferase